MEYINNRVLGDKSQALIFLIVFLLIVSLGVAGFYFISYTYEKKSSRDLEARLAMVEDQKNRLEKQIDEISKEKSVLEEKVKKSEELIPELQGKLDKETQAKKILMAEHESLQNEIAQLEREKKDTKVALDTKNQELVQLQIRLNTLILERDELSARLTEVSYSKGRQGQGEDLERIVVGSPSFEQRKPPLSTDVLLVNKEYGFVVLNAGSPEGIALGDVFEIFHRGASLGFVRIEKIHDTISAADFLEGFRKNNVGDGDLANRVN